MPDGTAPTPIRVGRVHDRQRDVLPLPIPPEGLAVLRSWCSAGAGKGSKEERRGRGVAAWVLLVVVQLNFMWDRSPEGWKSWPRGPGGPRQRAALERIHSAVVYFVDNPDEDGKLPIMPTWDWPGHLRTKKLSYQGEILDVAQRLTLDQVVPGLPPPGKGGTIPLLDWCEGETRVKLLSPELSFLPQDKIGVLPVPRVQASQKEWENIAKLLYERNIVREVAYEDIYRVRGQPVLAGAFGVTKRGKFLNDGRPVLRLIINLTPANMCQEAITGDVDLLSSAGSWLSLVLLDGEVMLVSGDDLVCSFYLFSLPECWAPYFTLAKPVSRASLFGSGDGMVWLSVKVLPMGWLSAVGVMQHAHRAILRWQQPMGAALEAGREVRKDRPQPISCRPSEGAAWHVYVDDFTEFEKVVRGALEAVRGTPGSLQARARKAYLAHGWPWAADKSAERSVQADRLGRHLDGEAGRIGSRTARLLVNASLALFLVGQPQGRQKRASDGSQRSTLDSH